MKYDHVSDFFWRTNLTKERQEAIVEWVKSLTKDQQKMIDEMIRDAQDEEHFNRTED